MKQHPCPLCGVVQMEGLGPTMRRISWSDKCACTDDHPCVAHSIAPEDAPDRPSHEEMEARWRAQRAKENERVQDIIRKFEEYESLRSRVTELEEDSRKLRSALQDISDENTGIEPALFAYAVLNAE